MGQKKVSLLVRCPLQRLTARVVYILGVVKVVLFREVSLVQMCPYREVPLYYNT